MAKRMITAKAYNCDGVLIAKFTGKTTRRVLRNIREEYDPQPFFLPWFIDCLHAGQNGGLVFSGRPKRKSSRKQ